MFLKCKNKTLDLTQPLVMGVLNITLDSFSDGGQFIQPELAIAQALAMQTAGAGIIDVGGESTRPGAIPVGLDEELDRVIPVIQVLAAELDVPVSIDTSKPQVMLEAVAAGAGMINDVNALQAEGALQAVQSSGAAICLMHKQGKPRTMQDDPVYSDVLQEVKSYLAGRIDACIAAGIAEDLIVIDPGFGFGKSLQHNLQLLRKLHEFTQLNRPVLVGLSRKSMLGTLTGNAVEQRVFASVAAAVLAFERGAGIIRVHDVAATVEALKVAQAVINE